MRIKIKPFIAIVVFIIASFYVCAAIEYKTLNAQYYIAECPADWIVDEIMTNSGLGGGIYPAIAVGVNGVGIYQRIDSKSEGMFKEDGSDK